jgi:hypothetical protein
MVQQIPVVPQAKGIGDLVRLGEILSNQDLAIEAASIKRARSSKGDRLVRVQRRGPGFDYAHL